jgi:hypothetical protein
VLLVVADLGEAALRRELERNFGRWPRAEVPAPKASTEPTLDGMTIRLVDMPGATQAHVRVGHLGLAHGDDDFLATTVVNQILGGSSVESRLGNAVREHLGGVGAASSSFDRNRERGGFVAAGVAPNDQAVWLMRLMIDEIGKLATDGATDAEVRQAETELAGSYAVRFDTKGEVGNALLAAALHELGDAYVRDFAVTVSKVTTAEVKAAAARRLSSKNLVVVLVGDAKVIEKGLRDAGLKYDKVAANEPIAAYERAALVAAANAPIDPKAAAAARAVLEDALAAKGGYERLSHLTSLRWKGKAVLNLPGGKIPAVVEKRVAPPDRLRLDMTVTQGNQAVAITTVLSGAQGWARQSQGGQAKSFDFPASEVAAGQNQIWRDQDLVLLRHRDKGATVAPLADVLLDGVAYHAIRVTNGDRSVVLLIDKKKKLLVGMRYHEQAGDAEERFSDYKAVKGIQIAHQRTTKSAQVDLSTTLDEVAVDEAFDPGLFVRPKD